MNKSVKILTYLSAVALSIRLIVTGEGIPIALGVIGIAFTIGFIYGDINQNKNLS